MTTIKFTLPNLRSYDLAAMLWALRAQDGVITVGWRWMAVTKSGVPIGGTYGLCIQGHQTVEQVAYDIMAASYDDVLGDYGPRTLDVVVSYDK